MSDIPDRMRAEIVAAGRAAGLPMLAWGEYCHAGKDGDCNWEHCPQEKNWQPCCPLVMHEEERGYQ